MTLPGYDSWKTYDRDCKSRCEFCGVEFASLRGWQPDECTGDCKIVWRDPDAEYAAKRDDDLRREND